MLIDSFKHYLLQLGYSEKDITSGACGDRFFEYRVDAADKLSVKYFFAPQQADVLETHRTLWNKNEDHVFIAVADERSYVINAKEKPDNLRPLKKSICLKSFDYGTNTIGFEQVKPSEITKEYVDSSFFFDFVSKNLKSRNEVDKDLLLNLLALKNELVDNGNDEAIHLLILRCLFVKYLEDRGIFDRDYLLSILELQNPKRLLEAFDEIRKINGDVFKYDKISANDIRKEHLAQLALFFSSDYRSGQHSLFPYRFDQIPIQLISHVYEAFLKGSSRRNKGIYYTPPFLVNFMLSQVHENKESFFIQQATYLDPAVGSGAFLVESFRAIQHAYGRPLTFEEKKKILKEQLFGIDIDRSALQIAAFSLYLALLEKEDPEFIKNEIRHAHPILPSLIGKSLIHANAITDDVFPDRHFRFIVSNPPWGSVPNDDADMDEAEKGEITKERAAMSGKSHGYPEYRNVSDYERSQAFLMRFGRWMGEDTQIVAVVKNSIFLNDNADGFREDLLARYQLQCFYELSHYNKILFKKRVIGKVGGKQVELGASEPCAVLVLSALKDKELNVNYISPKLSVFAEKFEVISYSSTDVFKMKQSALFTNDLYWRVLVNGDIEDFEVINKILGNKDISIEARAGFQPKKNMVQLGEPILKRLIEPRRFEQFDCVDIASLPLFNWNQKLHRKREEEIFTGGRILLPYRPLKSDKLLFRGVFLKEEVVNKDDIVSIKLKDKGKPVEDYFPYLAIFNSQLIGYVFFHLSRQWGKGEGKREKFRNPDIEALPIKRVDNNTKRKLRDLVLAIQEHRGNGKEAANEIVELNNIVFDHYGLLEYEKEIIKEFYQKRVDRVDRDLRMLTPVDMSRYFDAFNDTFSLILATDKALNSSFHISPNIGAVISFTIVDKTDSVPIKSNQDLHVLNFVKKGQLDKSEAMKLLREDTVKLYEKNCFFIIKSNLFKDWTVRQAIADAREEIGRFIEHLSN